MGNVLSDEKREQVIALGRLGWPLRRIEAETGVRRETASGYLKAAGVGIRAPGRASSNAARAHRATKRGASFRAPATTRRGPSCISTPKEAGTFMCSLTGSSPMMPTDGVGVRLGTRRAVTGDVRVGSTATIAASRCAGAAAEEAPIAKTSHMPRRQRCMRERYIEEKKKNNNPGNREPKLHDALVLRSPVTSLVSARSGSYH